MARWLITFQGFTGTGDKAKYPEMKKSASKGWLLGLGGIYLKGKNLRETLLLNTIMNIENSNKHITIEKPIWEKEINEKIDDLLYKKPNNLAELYTNWSRLLLIDEEKDIKVLKAVQLPGVNPFEFFLEPMTLWMYPKSGNNKDHFVPKPYNSNQAFWRSFGLVNMENNTSEKHRRPGIINWHNKLVEDKIISKNDTKLVAVGLNYNRDASTMPNDDIYDELNIYDEILADTKDEGWVNRINDEVGIIKNTIETILKGFANDIEKIRNAEKSGFTETVVQEAYYEVDLPFRQWLSKLRVDDSKEEKVKEWREILKNIILERGKKLIETSGKRDFLGIIQKEKIFNIEIAYNIFLSKLNKKLKEEKGEKNG